MAQLLRALQKVFGSTGGTGEFGKIGSKTAGAPATTKDIETMQSLSEYDQGMNAIVSDQGTSKLPYLEDINSLFFLTTSQLAYLMQAGVAEWDDSTEYYLDISIVLHDGILWKDKFGTPGTPNLNYEPTTNPDKWQPIASREKIVALTDGANIATDLSKGTVFAVTKAVNGTLDNPTNKVLGQSYLWEITQDPTGGRTLAFGTDFVFQDNKNEIDLAANAVTMIHGTVISSSLIRCIVFRTTNKIGIGVNTGTMTATAIEIKDRGGVQQLIEETGDNPVNLNADANRSAVDSLLSAILTKWNGTSVARIRAISGDDASNKDNAYFVFDVAEAGTLVEAMRIAQDGHVNIGDGTFIGDQLTVVSDSSTPTTRLYRKSSSATDPLATGRSNVTASNTLHIQIDTDGDIRNTNGVYGTISDIRLKNVIGDTGAKLNDFLKLQFINFTRDGSDLKQIGLSAQDVENIYPGLVKTYPIEFDNEGKPVDPIKDIDGNLIEDGIKSIKLSVLNLIHAKAFQEFVEETNQRLAILEDAILNNS